MSDCSDDEWRPPSEAEKKVIAARRERSDKISQLMGGYLLKGYKMLATVCRVCATIEMQDRQGQVYCIACNEVRKYEVKMPYSGTQSQPNRFEPTGSSI